jgi:zinc transport system ATP-binding protein
MTQGLELSDVSISLGGRSVVAGISFTLARSEVGMLVGPNGAGKSTLLRAIAGELPFAGAIRVPARVGYVPQRLDFDASSPLTALDLFAAMLSLRPSWLGVGTRTRSLALKALARFGAEEFLERRLGALSGGERQRVLLALATSPPPGLLLLDEPETGIDAGGVDELHLALDELRCEFGTAILVATHSRDSMERLNAKVLSLDHDGKPDGSRPHHAAGVKVIVA